MLKKIYLGPTTKLSKVIKIIVKSITFPEHVSFKV